MSVNRESASAAPSPVIGRAPRAAVSPSAPGAASGCAGGLLSLLPHGRASATSIPALRRLTNMSDREVRAAIEELVTVQHVPVVTAAGVFIAETPEDVDLAVANLRARSMAMLRRCRALRLARESLAWSPTLFPEV
ncbi:MAG: hypothetical protein M1274_15695 [Actinobacteria bacterium]|nr:hypothetical protein [Actinomycetota bacterium]